jgi:hypothetical protein
MRKVLCLGGGGTHGLSQMVVLSKLEEQYGPLYQHYDLMVGTSVGAINAAAIASGKITATNLLISYPEWLKIIFKKGWFFISIPKYDRKNFVNLWLARFGSIKMKDSKTKLIITSVDLCDDRNHYFKSYESEDGEEMLLNVILRSFAAPYYFSAIIDEEHQKVWSDGGISSNNLPIYDAITESLLLKWLQNEEVQFDIIGTGYINNHKPFNEVRKYKTIRQILDYLQPKEGGIARAQSREDRIEHIKKLAGTLPNIKFNYWDIEIDKKYDGLDVLNYNNKLIEYGETMAKKPIISM